MKSGTSFITGLLAGVAVGGVIALLYAPQSGKETREKIKVGFFIKMLFFSIITA